MTSTRISEIVHLSREWDEMFKWAEMANGDIVVWSHMLWRDGGCLKVYSARSSKCVAVLPLDSAMKGFPCVAKSRNLMLVVSRTKVYIYKGGPGWTRILNPVGFRFSIFRRLDFVKDESALIVSSQNGWFVMSVEGKICVSMGRKRLRSMLGHEGTIYPISHVCLDFSTIVLFVRPQHLVKSPLLVWDLTRNEACTLVDQEHSPHKNTVLFGIETLEDGRLISYCTDKLVVWKAYDKESWVWDPVYWRENLVDVVDTHVCAMALAKDNKILTVNYKGVISIFQAGKADIVFQASIESGMEDPKCFYRQGVEDVFFLQDQMTKNWIQLQFIQDEHEWEITPLPKTFRWTRAIQPILAKTKNSPLFRGDMTREGIRIVFSKGVFRMLMPSLDLKVFKQWPHVHEELMATLYAPPDPSYDFPGGVLYCQLAKSTTFVLVRVIKQNEAIAKLVEFFVEEL